MFLWLVTSTSWPHNKRFPWLIPEHFYVKFGEPSCIGFWDIVRKSRQTHRQTTVKTYHRNHVGVSRPNNYCHFINQPVITTPYRNWFNQCGAFKLLACAITKYPIYRYKKTNDDALRQKNLILLHPVLCMCPHGIPIKFINTPNMWRLYRPCYLL